MRLKMPKPHSGLSKNIKSFTLNSILLKKNKLYALIRVICLHPYPIDIVSDSLYSVFVLIELPYDPAIPLLGTHTEETRIERDTCTSMFITALFTIARTWKQPRCPSADEWIRKLWYTYTMQCYSAIKNSFFEFTFESVLMRWMKLKPIIQSKVSQKEKHQYSIVRHIYGI